MIVRCVRCKTKMTKNRMSGRSRVCHKCGEKRQREYDRIVKKNMTEEDRFFLNLKNYCRTPRAAGGWLI
jgi:hypothetical protein